MRINSVELENYRIHKNVKFEFGNGINLILGKNGAGKSSILEAIGMALFGADSRTSDKEAVKNGEKSSYICIEITGNDGIEYIVEKKIGNSSLHRLYPKDNKSEAVTGVEPVLAKIAEISGIEKNSKKIYQNVITAYQNKIVNIFTETQKNRETLFNEIFDTAIYREMYQGYLKTAIDKYIIEKKVIEKEVGEIEILIEDKEEIIKEIEQKKEIENLKNKEFIKLKEKLEEIEKEIKISEDAKRNFERLEKEIEDRKKMIAENETGIEKSEEGIKKGEDSAQIVKESEESYKKYILIEKEINEQEKEIAGKEIIKKEIEKADKRLEEENRKKVEISTLKTEKSEQFKELTELIEKTEERVKIKENILIEFCENLKKIKDRSEIKKELLQKGEEYQKQYERIEKELNETENKIKIIEESHSDIIELKNSLKTTEDKIKDLKEKVELKKEIDEIIKGYEIKESELKKAEEKLSGGICPYLKEECLNIGENINFKDYFNKRINEIELKRKEKQKESEEFKESEKELENKSGERAVILQKIENFEKSTTEIRGLKIKAELGNEKIENILLRANIDLKTEEKISDFEKLKNRVKKINMEIVSEKKEIEEKEKRESELKEEAEREKIEEKTLKEKENRIRKEIDKLTEEEKNSNKIIVIAEQFIKEKFEKIFNLEELKKTISELKENKEKVKNGYDLYNANIKTALTLDEMKRNLINLKNIRDIKIKEVIEKERERSIISEKFSFEEIDKLIYEKKEILNIKEKIQEELTQCKIEKGKAEEKYEEYKRKNENLKEKRKKLKKLEKKIEITQKFRDNVNTMGKAVAAGLLSSIEKSATENFRRMTGRDEEINWINGEKESYSVYLNGEERGNSKFEVLSGGEQVAVALSIRAAMASTLTTADFAIFDEPTINLDKIRKESLAESLKEILKDFQQAIIVTHDDIFEEMAERIIIIE